MNTTEGKVSTQTSSHDPPALRRKRPALAEELVEAAAELFDRKGFANTSVQDVAESAGVTKGGFYTPFSFQGRPAVRNSRPLYLIGSCRGRPRSWHKAFRQPKQSKRWSKN